MRLMLFFLAAAVFAEPGPGDVFREYTYAKRFGEVDPGAKRKGIDNMLRAAMRERVLEIPSLAGVTRAEVSIEYWGGHIGTSGQRFRVNGGEWIGIPQPQGTPGRPQCYYRTILGRATVPVPVSALKPGRNVFQFTAGPQICYSFDWGFYWVYAFTARLYTSAPAPQARVAVPAVLGENPVLRAEPPAGAKVDFIAEYEDFNWEGDGIWRQWHYITERGSLARHAGAGAWDTTWVPDQDRPIRIAARVAMPDGTIFITPAATARFERAGRSVKLYKPSQVPEVFGVRVGRRKECKIAVPDSLAKARAARLVLSTWSAAHADEIGLNGVKLVDRVGRVHDYSFDSIPVPLSLLRSGENTFHIFSNTREHAAEVNWPGPALLVEYQP